MSEVKEILKVALIQMSASSNQEENILTCIEMSRAAIAKGAQFILLPEVYAFRRQKREKEIPFEPLTGPSVQPFLDLAKMHKCWILCGSIYEEAEQEKGYNSSVLVTPDGNVSHHYRKIHLFSLKNQQASIDEGLDFTPGVEPVIANVAGYKVGLSICYDLRFPELYRCYANLGAVMMTVPSSFTQTTGQAHWHALCRARAIENQCFVLAPNQVGIGAGAIPSYGHSLIVDPWGEILAEGSGDQEEVLFYELNMHKIQEVRKRVPAQNNRQL
eukprot:COSAG01_NODE_814_length_13398_cov_4.254230_12_plen_272_part_00